MSLKQRGAALITTLIMIVIVGGIALLMFNRSMSEMNHSRDNVAITQTMMLARGGANAGGAILANLRDEIQVLVETKGSSSDPWVFGGSGSDAPDPEKVAKELKDVAASLQNDANSDLCNQNFKPQGSSATVSVRVYFTNTACNLALPANTRLPDGRFVLGKPRSQQNNENPADLQTYSLPFVMVAEAQQGQYKRNIVLQGEYQFNVGRSSFARYAYFANDRRVNGNFVYFSTGEMIDGPVHSNEYLRFSGKPWFGSEVTVASCTDPGTTGCSGKVNPGDYFNGANFVAETSIDTFCKSNDCPTFADKKSFSAAFIPLPSENSRQRTIAQNSGLLFSKTLKDLRLYTMTEAGKTYQVIQAEQCANTPNTSNPNDLTCDTPTTLREFRFGETKVAGQGYALEEKINGTWQAYTNNGTPYYFKGVVYTDGGIANLGGPERSNASDPQSAAPSVATFAQMTIAGTGRMVISRDIKYADPPCSNTAQWNNGNVIKADCTNLEVQNILGIYSQKGDVLFGTGTASTLTNLTVHATVMSSEGRVGVNNWNTVTNTKSNLNILGGLIGKSVAGFASSGGYLRNITYDKRLGEGLAPPYFPTTGGDQVKAVFLFSYGQREQVY